MNADGSVLKPLTTDFHKDWDPAWSSDGTQIAFGSFRTGNEELWVMNADGSNQRRLPTDGTNVRRLTTNKVTDARPAWAPDGSDIIFQSELESVGGRQLYLVRPDGTKPRQLSWGGEGWWVAAPNWQSVKSVDPCQTRGTILDDTVRMLDGDDIICALAGNDRVTAGKGDDVVDGGPRDDWLSGGPGDDILKGGLGNDTFVGGPGIDALSCGPGHDTAVADTQDHVAVCEVVKRS